MSNTVIEKTGSLTPERFAQIEALAQICSVADGGYPKIYKDLLATRRSQTSTNFLCFIDSTLVGFLALFYFANTPMEIIAFVHPDHRQQGIFKRLWTHAKQAIQNYRPGRAFPIYLPCHPNCESGKKSLQALGAIYSHSEYDLELSLPAQIDLKSHPLTFFVAGLEDVHDIATLHSQCFTTSYELIREHIQSTITEANRAIILAKLNGRLIGKIHLSTSEGDPTVKIFDFCIHPDVQRRGYGTVLLNYVIEQLNSRHYKNLVIGVLSDNKGALLMYQKVGFVLFEQYDFWKLDSAAVFGF